MRVCYPGSEIHRLLSSNPLRARLGLWICGYVGLSLSLALCWVLLVSFGRMYQRGLGWTAVPASFAAGTGTLLGFYFWRQQDLAFHCELSHLESGLVSTTRRVPHRSRDANRPEAKESPPFTRPRACDKQAGSIGPEYT
jgi:hypothetical protein